MANRMSLDNYPVYDATEPLTVEIETCDIEEATPGDPSNCAAARAILRAHGLIADVRRSRVYLLSYSNDLGEHYLRYGVPPGLRDEEIVFDRGGRFEPQTFTLPVLKPSSRTGQRQGSDSANRTGRKRSPRRVMTGLRPRA